MLNKLFTTFFVIILVVIGFTYVFRFQSAARVNAQNDQITSLLKQMEAADSDSRRISFYELLELGFESEFNGRTAQIPSALSKLSRKHPSNADEINLTLIRLLETENNLVREQEKRFKLTGETLTEEYSDYYGDLIATVADLKDSRAVTALVGAINTGNMATNALVELAPFSIHIVAEKVDSNEMV